MNIEQVGPTSNEDSPLNREELLNSLVSFGADPAWLGYMTNDELAAHLAQLNEESDELDEREYRDGIVAAIALYGVGTGFTDGLSIAALDKLIEELEDEEEARHAAEESELEDENPEDDYEDDPNEEDPLKGEVDPVGGYH